MSDSNGPAPVVERVGHFQLDGEAEGFALVLSEPLSFWGGVDVDSGEIIDRSHPEAGANVAGKILVMPSGRGSSSSASVLAEAIHSGTAPAGILLQRPDPILVAGAIVAEFLYGTRLPLAICDTTGLTTGSYVQVGKRDDGRATIAVGEPRLS